MYWGGASLGVDAEDYARRSAATTCVDTGSAGPGNFASFRRRVIERSAVRILPYLHISFAGVYGFSNRVMVGEGHDLRLLAARDCLDVTPNSSKNSASITTRAGVGEGSIITWRTVSQPSDS